MGQPEAASVIWPIPSRHTSPVSREAPDIPRKTGGSRSDFACYGMPVILLWLADIAEAGGPDPLAVLGGERRDELVLQPVDGELVFKRRLAAGISRGSGFASRNVRD